MVISWSKSSKCNKIESNGLKFGRNTTKFKDWIEKNPDKAKDLKKYQCTMGHTLITIFFSVSISVLILSVVYFVFMNYYLYGVKGYTPDDVAIPFG